jgi:putative ABC transport system permease protein
MRTYLFAEILHRAGRSVSTALGVAVGVALFIALIAVGAGFREAARRPLAGVRADILLSRPAAGSELSAAAQTTRGVRLPFGTSTMTLDDVSKEARIAGVSAAAGGLLLWDFGPTSYQTVLGVDTGQAAVGPTQARQWVVAGRFLQPGEHGVAVVDKHYAAFFRLKPGNQVSIGGRPFQVVGIVEVQDGSQAAAANFYVPLADAQALAGVNTGAINQIYVQVAQASSVDQVVQQSRASLGDVSATTEQSIVQVMGGISRVSDRFAGVAALTALLGGLLLTGLALSSSVSERRTEIGVMKAVGWTARDVSGYFVTEGLTLATAGALAGILLGWLVTLGLGLIPIDMGPLSASTPAGIAIAPATSSQMTLPAQVSLPVALLALGLTAVGGTLVSWLVARRAATMKPAEAFRSGS